MVRTVTVALFLALALVVLVPTAILLSMQNPPKTTEPEPAPNPVPTKADFLIQVSSPGCWNGSVSFDTKFYSVCGDKTWRYTGEKVWVNVRADPGDIVSVSIHRNGSLCFTETDDVVQDGCTLRGTCSEEFPDELFTICGDDLR